MAGFVIVDAETRWSINNVGWRLIFEPVERLLSAESSEGRAVAHAVRGGLHYLDLAGASPATRRAVGLAVNKVRHEHASKPEKWTAAFALADFLAAVDRLVEWSAPGIARAA